MEPHESPWGLGGIRVKYEEGRLIERDYNPQWVKREDQEAYEQKQKAETGRAGK